MDQAACFSEEPVQASEVTVSIYLDHIPEFVEDELRVLCGHIRSSLPYLRIFKTTDQVSTYVARHGATPTAILLFRLERCSIVVLNEMIQIDEEELRRFAASAFERFRSVAIIRFPAVLVEIRNFPYPLQRSPNPDSTGEDLIITLPATPEDYIASLGKTTRQDIRRKMRKLERDFPSFSFQSYKNEEIDERLFYDLIRYKETRITASKRKFHIDEDRARHLMDLAKLCGSVNAIWIDGRVCASTIKYRFGSDESMEVIVHDPKYNDYSLGMLCIYLDLCESITNGIKRFHLGGGRDPYKLRLRGVPENMEQLTIYRSPGQMILNCDWATKIWITTRRLKFKVWMRDHEAGPVARFIRFLFRSRDALREIRKRI